MYASQASRQIEPFSSVVRKAVLRVGRSADGERWAPRWRSDTWSIGEGVGVIGGQDDSDQIRHRCSKDG